MNSDAFSPVPPSEWGQWVLALSIFLLAVRAIVAVLSGTVRVSASHASAEDPPVVLVDTAGLQSGMGTAAGHYAGVVGVRVARIASSVTAEAGAPGAADSGEPERTAGSRVRTSGVPSVGAIVASPVSTEPSGAAGQSAWSPEGQISAGWEAGFYPIYGEAQRVFGVDWLLLASIHKQESGFSTALSTYHGLNFAGCCGGPMQFNVTNGPISTWDLVRNAYLYGRRPAAYDHRTARHPSIYDDYDSIMAAAWLLSSDGASLALDDSAWRAAYDYYGHNAVGVEYADEVLARAIGWSQHGFCINCGVDSRVAQAVEEADGAPVMAAYKHRASVSRSVH